VFTFIPDSAYGAMLPVMSQSSRNSSAELPDLLPRGCRYLFMIGLPIAGGICVLADRLVLLLFGPAYLAAVPALRLLVWMVPLSFLDSALITAIFAVDQERRASLWLCWAALFNLLINLLAIPRFGHVGAAAAILATEGLIVWLQARLLRQRLPHFRLLGQMVKPLAAAIVMVTFTWVSRGAGLVYTVLGAAAVYLGSLIVLRAMGPEEWAILRGVIRPSAFDERA